MRVAGGERHRIPASFARRSATASICADASTPVTIAPRVASAIAARPVPVPTSSTRAAGDRREKPRDDLFLRLGDQAPDRPAEAQRVERFRHRGIGVDGVAVVIGARLRRARHATPSGNLRVGSPIRCAQAWRVRVRYAS